MVKKEKIVSVRLSEDTLAKLDMLMELNKHDSESQINVRMTKTDIMNLFIRFRFLYLDAFVQTTLYPQSAEYSPILAVYF